MLIKSLLWHCSGFCNPVSEYEWGISHSDVAEKGPGGSWGGRDRRGGATSVPAEEDLGKQVLLPDTYTLSLHHPTYSPQVFISNLISVVFNESVTGVLCEFTWSFLPPMIYASICFKEFKMIYSPHPYLFFNMDRITMTFLGFNIDRQTGNLVDAQTGRVLEAGIMQRNLQDALKRNRVPINENFDGLPR